jgi:hypothetical protein
VSELAFLKSKSTLVALVILCWAIVASSALGYYYYKYFDLSQRLEAVPVHVTVSIDYGNDTVTTFENVYLFRNATALDALRAIANVTTEPFTGMGLLVVGVDGLLNDWMGAGKGWQYWLNGEYGLEAADKQILINGDSVDWKYTTYQGPA